MSFTPVAVLMAVFGAPISEPSLSAADMTNERAGLVAERLLGPEIAARVVKAEIEPSGMLPGHWWFRAAEASVGTGDQCRRTSHVAYPELARPREGEAGGKAPVVVPEVRPVIELASVYPDAATAETCGAYGGDWTVVAADDVEASSQALRRLTDIMRTAGQGDRGAFTITCAAEPGAGRADCVDRRIALATLPMRALFNIRTSEEAGGAERFQSDFDFGRSGASGWSWRVRLLGEAGRVEAVEMRRLQIIYH